MLSTEGAHCPAHGQALDATTMLSTLTRRTASLRSSRSSAAAVISQCTVSVLQRRQFRSKRCRPLQRCERVVLTASLAVVSRAGPSTRSLVRRSVAAALLMDAYRVWNSSSRTLRHISLHESRPDRPAAAEQPALNGRHSAGRPASEVLEVLEGEFSPAAQDCKALCRSLSCEHELGRANRFRQRLSRSCRW